LRSICISILLVIFFLDPGLCFSQKRVHPNAHAHNDYEHAHPLKEALQNGFISVEADVHLYKGELRVAHSIANVQSPTLQELYLIPLDSLIKANKGSVYSGDQQPFFLMIDLKTNGEETYQVLKSVLSKYEMLLCTPHVCPVKIFLSGQRPLSTIVKEGYAGIGMDGRPDDLGKQYPVALMPVISDNFANWSSWNGQRTVDTIDLQRIKVLAQRVHAEGKKLRLWAIPDNETVWKALLDAGVDLINTDRLPELNAFLTSKGL
jgi:Glycerophosphoryl diester phosphodiesterase family